jgi:L-asparaginase
MGKKKILFIATGGTFSSVQTAEGIKPGFGVQAMIDKFPEAKAFADIDGIELCHLDSTNVQPSDWTNFANAVGEHHDSYDGFVIGHGTDTMAQSAAGLSFALAGIQKPVIFTGSALSADHPKTDARQNFIDAVTMAATTSLKGVFISFSGKVIDGTHARKAVHDAESSRAPIDLYSSVGAPLVGSVKDSVFVPNPLYRRHAGVHTTFQSHIRFDTRIAYLPIVPGMDSAILKKFQECRAIVLSAFGDGNVPFAYSNWLSDIAVSTARGVPVFVVTQTGGAVDMNLYEVGVKAQAAGAVSCEDMTVESVTAKLMWIGGNFPNLSGAAFVEKFKENIVGEFYARPG